MRYVKLSCHIFRILFSENLKSFKSPQRESNERQFIGKKEHINIYTFKTIHSTEEINYADLSPP